MRLRGFQAIVICLYTLAPVFAQTATPATSPSSPTPARSHVDRFSSTEVRAERDERDATAKLTVNPNDVEAINARAYARMALGRYKEAYEDLRRAVTLKPTSAEYQAGLGYTLWKIGRHNEAVEAERSALKLDDKNFTAHYQLGRFLVFTGSNNKQQLAEAASHLRRALEIDPRRSEIRFDLLTAYRMLGDNEQALVQLRLLENSNPSDPRVTYIDALLAADRGDMNTAISGFRQALRQDPALYGAQQDLGLAYSKLGRWNDAIEIFAGLAKHQPDSIEVAYFYALSLFNAGRVAEAERETRRALRLDAGADAAHTLLGIILASRGADVEASESLTQAVAINPNSFDANFYLGRVKYALGEFAAAAKSLHAASLLNPKHAEARFFLGTALEAAGESDAALVEYQQLTQLDPQSAIGQVGLGALQVKQGKIEDAIATLKRATSLDPKIFEAHWALGRAFILAQRFPEAIESLKTAVAILPERADAHYQLGLALRRAGSAEEAKSEFATVERLNAEFRARTLKN
jgi:Flp pilus assembly protein TadD